MNLQFVCKTKMEPLNYIHIFVKNLHHMVGVMSNQVGEVVSSRHTHFSA
jgi:hypothetical protein